MGKITVVYNNVKGDERLKTGWGLSMLVEEAEDLVLFDVGPCAEDFLFNLNVLDFDRKRIHRLAISHLHRDHRGALDEVLREMPKDAELFLPPKVKGKKEIAKCVYVYPVKGLNIVENVLVIDSSKGLIILVGCAHPGIYRICRTIKDDFNKNIYAVLGGFHFEYYPSLFVKVLGRLLKNLGIEIIGPNHCTGERANKVLRQIFKEGFLDFGCGKTLVFYLFQSCLNFSNPGYSQHL